MPEKHEQVESRFLRIYLNDHLAGAVAGTELARRVARTHRDGPDGATLRSLAEEITEDFGSMLEIMAKLDVPARRYKVLVAWLGEKIGRVKPNGRIFARSPLSTVIELEMLWLGVEGKTAGWRTLRTMAEREHRLDTATLDRLLARAEAQASALDQLRLRAAGATLAQLGS